MEDRGWQGAEHRTLNAEGRTSNAGKGPKGHKGPKRVIIRVGEYFVFIRVQIRKRSSFWAERIGRKIIFYFNYAGKGGNMREKAGHSIGDWGKGSGSNGCWNVAAA